ncbi:MAG: HD domain-containing protein, partial [Akkermansiaceae bacterium]|nr:HD domain-containing protein [Verrucomicrobiales bacterium]
DPVREDLHDWIGGQVDLEAKIIRTIGSPAERFAEDHLRLLRAIRFAAQLGFEIEARTLAALRENASKIKAISAERIRDELLKLFRPPHAARGLDLLRESQLLEHVFPELNATIHCEQSPDYHPEGSVFNHLRLMLSQLPDNADPLLAWAVLLHDIAKPLTASRDPETGSIHFYEHERIGAEMAEKILERLRFPRKQIDAVAQAVRYHMQLKDAPQMRKSTLRRLLMRETFPLEMELHRLDCQGSHQRLDIYHFLIEQARELEKQPEIIPPLVSGNDLIALGVKPGPDIGALLAEIREKQLQDELKTAEEALGWARKQLGSKV